MGPGGIAITNEKGRPKRTPRFHRFTAALRTRAAARDRRHAATVLRVAGLVRLRAHRPFLAVGDRLDPARRHAKAHEIFLHRIRTARTEREVVFTRATLVAVAF